MKGFKGESRRCRLEPAFSMIPFSLIPSATSASPSLPLWLVLMQRFSRGGETVVHLCVRSECDTGDLYLSTRQEETPADHAEAQVLS